MRVLYICTGNSFRSPAAEALTRKFYPRIEVESAGIDATDHIAGNMKDMIEEEDALEYVKPSPDQVSERALNEADRIVAMEQEHRDYIHENFDVPDRKIEVWNVRDPIRPDVEPGTAFNQIREKVKQLRG